MEAAEIEAIMGELDAANAAAAGGGIAAALAGLLVSLIFGLVIYVVAAFILGKVFVKAGQPMWAAFVPIYNIYILTTQILGRPWWWILLLLLPIVDIVILIILMIDLAKAFGKDIGFAIGLILLSIIFMAILGFGDAQYQGPVADPNKLF